MDLFGSDGPGLFVFCLDLTSPLFSQVVFCLGDHGLSLEFTSLVLLDTVPAVLVCSLRAMRAIWRSGDVDSGRFLPAVLIMRSKRCGLSGDLEVYAGRPNVSQAMPN